MKTIVKIKLATLIASILWLIIAVDYVCYAIAWLPIVLWLFNASNCKELKEWINSLELWDD